MLILGIESSCDETAASVVKDGKEILSSVISTQIEEHKKYGGVVPEIASRRHCENILEVVEKALSDSEKTLDDIDAVAVTYAPGLIGALLVGVSFAKGLAISANKPPKLPALITFTPFISSEKPFPLSSRQTSTLTSAMSLKPSAYCFTRLSIPPT